MEVFRYLDLINVFGHQEDFTYLIVSTETSLIGNKRGSLVNELFRVLAKLFGISQFFSSLILLFAMLSQFQNFVQSKAGMYMALPFLGSLLLLGFSLALIFKTEWVASAIGATSGTDSAATSISPRSLLKIGIILVGLNIFLSGFNQIISFIFSISMYLRENIGSPLFQNVQFIGQAIAGVSPVVLSLFLIFGSEKIIQLLEKFGTQVS
jgi:hypothetical protein